jgi:hypothetical protein
MRGSAKRQGMRRTDYPLSTPRPGWRPLPVLLHASCPRRRLWRGRARAACGLLVRTGMSLGAAAPPSVGEPCRYVGNLSVGDRSVGAPVDVPTRNLRPRMRGSWTKCQRADSESRIRMSAIQLRQGREGSGSKCRCQRNRIKCR